MPNAFFDNVNTYICKLASNLLVFLSQQSNVKKEISIEPIIVKKIDTKFQLKRITHLFSI